jgi:glutaredoxin
MFFLVPRIALILFVCFAIALAWRAFRQRRSQWRRVRHGRGPLSRLPLLPAEVLKGADRTWVVFTTPDCEPCLAVARRLRAAEPSAQVTEVDARHEPRLAEAYRVDRLPAVLLANRYGQVEARLIGLAAIESALAG